MYRHSPSRNQRSKGIKIKHILQICVLLAVCFWLIYQVKHSRDKKKEFDEKDSKVPVNIHSGSEVIKLGRKDLHPQLEGTAREIEKKDEDEADDETVGEEEENKHEEEEQEEDKTEDEKDETRGGGDDEIDEHEQEKSDLEVDHEEDFVDDEREREGDEKETEDNDSQTENENTAEEHEHDGVARNTHEAREEQYNADDASSAVTHDPQNIGTENENGTLDNSNLNTEGNIVEQENNVNNTEEINASQNFTEVKAEDGETGENGAASNTTVKEMGSKTILDDSSLNTTIQSNNSADVSKSELLQNGTDIRSDSTQAQNNSEGGMISGQYFNPQTNYSIASGNNESNSTISAATQNSEGGSDFVGSQTVLRSDGTSAEEVRSGSSETETNTDASQTKNSDTNNVMEARGEANTDASQNENSDTNNVIEATDETNIDASQNENSDTNNVMEATDESSGSSETEDTNEVQHDPIDSSDSSLQLDEKEVRTDVDTFPEIRIDSEGNNGEDAE